jgi:hypothetical protein
MLSHDGRPAGSVFFFSEGDDIGELGTPQDLVLNHPFLIIETYKKL